MSLFQVRRWLAVALTAMVALPLYAASVAAQTGVLTGKVTDAENGRPIENAQVQVQAGGGQNFGAVSDAEGNYRAVNLPPGSYTVTVRLLGYLPRTFPGTRITEGTTTSLNIQMIPRVVELNQTVVTASRNRPEKALDAPASISVVSSERIEEKPAVTVSDHLRATAGVDINKGGIAQSNIVARGFNNAFSGAMLMLQDYRFAGVPSLRVNVPFLMTGTNEDIERIEVLLGPASALYGPNSANGVLHVITKSPFTSQGTTISLDGGERSVMRGGLRYAGTTGNRIGYKLSGEFMRGKDWEYRDLAERATFGTTFVPADRVGKANDRDFDLQRMTGEARLDLRPRDGVELISTVGYTKIATGMELTGANGTSQIKDWSYMNLQQRMRWNRVFGQVFLNNSNAGNDTSSSTAGTFLLRSGQPIVDKSRVAGAQLQHGFDMAGGKQTFTYGGDYIWTNPRTGNTINGKNEDVDDVTEYGAYVQSSTRPTTRTEIILAGRGDKNNVIDGAFFSPRAALIFKPTETQNVRFTYNRAFSTPANFSFFLDLIQSPNIGGSGFDLIAKGNPPKEGWQFRRGCTGSAMDDYCMKSRFVSSGAYTAATAHSALPGLVGGNAAALTAAITPAVTGALAAAGITAAQAATIAAGMINSIATSQPTSTHVGTRISLLTSATTPVTAAALSPIAPLEASFNNTYELGYKGIVGSNFRFDVSLWRQGRGDVGTSAALVTPNVFFDLATAAKQQQFGGFLGSTMGAYLVPAILAAQPNLPGGVATATAIANQLAPGIAGALVPQLAPAPLGVVTFDNPNASATAIYATYKTVAKELWVTGLDLAADVVASDRLTFDVAYSFSNKNVFKGIEGGNGAPLMSNSPNSRGSFGGRYRNADNGIGAEVRLRYAESFPVNSGVYATNVAFPIAAGRPGAVTTALPATALGYNRCAPAAAGTFCYENVPETFTFDAQVSKKFDLGAQRFMWSINATNLFNNKVRTFPGVPEIGRLVMTRLQYTF